MKNSLISILLFIVLFSFLLYADYSFKRLCTDVINFCDDMEDGLLSKSAEKNFKDSMELFNTIQKRDTIASIYINHMDYDVMLNEALKLSVYLEQGDITEAEASLHILKYSTEHMKKLQYPNLKNIF